MSTDLTRRRLLRYLAYGGAGVAGAGALASCSNQAAPAAAPEPPVTAMLGENVGKRNLRDPARDGRLLIVVELGGGNDGLSTMVPFESGRYRDLRPTLAVPADEVIDWGDGWGLNERLAAFDARGVAVVAGVGSTTPDLSHFAMLDRWWKGYVDGVPGDQVATATTGVYGRLCDAVMRDEHFTGVSLRIGNPPSLKASKAATLGLTARFGALLDQDPAVAALMRETLEGFAGKRDDVFVAPRSALADVIRSFDLIRDLPAPSEGYPETDIGVQMAAASRLARSDAGIRVIHVPHGGSSYDTHSRHAETHPLLLTELNDAVDALLRDLDDVGLSDSVLLATQSEFGRRVQEHGGGLDHGAASVMLLLGPVVPGLHGEHSSLDDLDVMGNLVATTPFDRYLATLATWMEVDPGQVLPKTGSGLVPEEIPGLLTK